MSYPCMSTHFRRVEAVRIYLCITTSYLHVLWVAGSFTKPPYSLIEHHAVDVRDSEGVLPRILNFDIRTK
jgi:hypothetical protein